MKPLCNILVGIDFSSTSRCALKTALRLAAQDQATVTAVHIVDPVMAAAVRRLNGFTDLQIITHAQDTLKRFLAESDLGTGLVQTHVEIDHALAGLVSTCNRTRADLLILGTRGIAHEANQVGAVASKCIRKAPADVLLVREGGGDGFTRVLACVDYSETSALAVEAAAHVAESDGAALDCVYVYPSPVALSMGYDGLMPPPMVYSQEDLAECQKELESFVKPLLITTPGVTAKCEVFENLGIRQALIHHAQETHADLVVLGTRGTGGFQTMVMGTTAESIIKRAACSVLVVKPQKLLQPQLGGCKGNGRCCKMTPAVKTPA